MLSLLFLGCLAALSLGYIFYGAFLRKSFGLDDARPTPAVALEDGVDYCAASTPVLFGHHFSSIAGAGPIVGPVLAGIAFGWLPALIWIVLGSIFIGGVHDMGALAASIRHRARSIAEIARENITPRAGKLFLAFVWLALVLVLAAFIDLTAETFVADGGVAASSALYIVLAVCFGLLLYRFRIRLATGTLLFVPLVFGAIWVGQLAPVTAPAGTTPEALRTGIILALAAYCGVASLAPVWLLLQPRDYLSSFLLYACLGGGVAGLLLSGASIQYPAVAVLDHPALGFVLPALFIVVACGACSGFHSVVASGTTAKQLPRETAAQPVAYGAMLVEGLLAVLALATVMVVSRDAVDLTQPATAVFAAGLGGFLESIGISRAAGTSFGLLAISAFLLTTLDTATRLARYVLEELLGLKGWGARIAATAGTLAVPLLIVQNTVQSGGREVPAYAVIWPVFGATNQLLGGLALLTIAVWLKRSRGKPLAALLFVVIPMVFMIGMTIWGLVLIIAGALSAGATAFDAAAGVKAGTAGVLLVLALVVIVEACGTLARSRRPRAPAP